MKRPAGFRPNWPRLILKPNETRLPDEPKTDTVGSVIITNAEEYWDAETILGKKKERRIVNGKHAQRGSSRTSRSRGAR